MADELDLDEARAVLADNGIDGPDLPYNPRALHAMRVADRLLAEVERLRARVVYLEEHYDAVMKERDVVTGERDDALLTISELTARPSTRGPYVLTDKARAALAADQPPEGIQQCPQ